MGDGRLAEMAASGAGDQAFSAIYARYHQPLYRYCQSLVRDPDEAADALQSAMLKAYLALPAKRVEVELRPWLFRIVHNEAISALRRRPRHDEISDLNSAAVASAHDDAAARARLDQLVDDLQQLDERQRAAMVMRELSGLSYDEIAAAFGTTTARAHHAVYEARVALHERAEGRAMPCEPVRRAVSAGDGRKLRARKLRAHLRACADCRQFERALGRRRADLAILTPALPAPAAAAVLNAVVGGGAAGAGEAGLGAAAAAKTLAALVGVAAGAGALNITAAPDIAAPSSPPQHSAVAIARHAPPLTSVYALSGGHVRIVHLRAPNRLLADASPRGAGPGHREGETGDYAPTSAPGQPPAPLASLPDTSPVPGAPDDTQLQQAPTQVGPVLLPPVPADPVATIVHT